MYFMIFWGEEKMKTREDKRMVKIVFLATLFGHILKNISARTPFGAWSFLLIDIQFTYSEGPKGFVNWFFKKMNHGS